MGQGNSTQGGAKSDHQVGTKTPTSPTLKYGSPSRLKDDTGNGHTRSGSANVSLSKTASKDFRDRLAQRRRASEFEEEYSKLRELGSGITGQVFLVVNKRGQEKAMKTINLSRINRAQLKELRLEVSLLKSLDHPNIVRLQEVFEDPKNVMLIMDYCKGGSLASKTGRVRLRTEREVASVMYQLFLAIKFVHDKNIIHRDIKLENVLFASEESTSLHVQLIDFGLSGVQKPSPFWMLRGKKKRLFATTCGTTFYMAPEVIDGKYDQQCDIWSLGVLTFLLLTGKPPFRGEDERSTIKNIKFMEPDFSAPIWKKLNPHAEALVRNLLIKDPAKRWTAAKALQSPWFEAYRQEIDQVMGGGATLETDIVSSLSKFVEYSQMKKMAMLVMAHHSSIKELAHLKTAFLAFDKDNSGSITFNELKELFAKHNISDQEANQLFAGMDIDDSGEIQLTEFLAATMEATCKIDRERLADAFDHIAQGQSYITTNHLESLLGKIDKNQLRDMIKSLDENGDGKISREEFLTLVDEKQEDELEEMIENDDAFVAVRETDSE